MRRPIAAIVKQFAVMTAHARLAGKTTLSEVAKKKTTLASLLVLLGAITGRTLQHPLPLELFIVTSALLDKAIASPQRAFNGSTPTIVPAGEVMVRNVCHLCRKTAVRPTP